jgi:hypothetical protein
MVIEFSMQISRDTILHPRDPDVGCELRYGTAGVRECRENQLLQRRNLLLNLTFFLALQPSAGYGLLVSRGFLITHNDAPQLVGLL